MVPCYRKKFRKRSARVFIPGSIPLYETSVFYTEKAGMLTALRLSPSRSVTMNYTYILLCSDNTYYTGWTNDLSKRLKAHNSGNGARYTKPRLPVSLVYYEVFETRREAMHREYETKQLSRSKKESLITKGSLSYS